MSYKSLLVHADQSPGGAARITLAVQLAAACDAHLTMLACTGLSRFARPADLARPWPAMPQQVAAWREQAHASLAMASQLATPALRQQPTLCLLDDDPEDALLRQAPFHDLLVVSQTDPHHAAPGVIRDLPQNLMLQGGRPLLLTPYRGSDDGVATAPFRHPLLAWDGSRAAVRAISDALPMLKQATTVTLLLLNPPPGGADAADSGADMALFLARHCVPVTVMREYTTVGIADALLCVAAELRCDLLVMGGYGHHRARETVLGGVTRTILSDMGLPVLMSH